MLGKAELLVLINQSLNLNIADTSEQFDAKLKSLGVDSLDIFNVLVELENATGKKVPDEDVEKLTTIRSLIDYFS